MKRFNTVYCGDNLEWMQKIPDESVDLCYIDPPFFSNRNYEVLWGNSVEKRAFGDRFRGGIQHYTAWMKERIVVIHRKLKRTGSIYLHCDYHATHYLRLTLDEVFGEKNFRNEILWCYSRMSSRGQRQFSRVHDTILWYSKSHKKWTFNVDDIRSAYAEGSLKREGRTLNKLGSGRPKEGVTVLNPKGKFPDDWIADIAFLRGNERIGYKTQKPEALIRRFILASSNEGDWVLDCFGGGGTTAKVCADLGRHFIIGDVSEVAVRVIANRLNVYQPETDYKIIGLCTTEKELRAMNGHAFAELVCQCMGWEVSEKKSGDKGIDGWADNNKIPVQIKNQRQAVGRPLIQQFVGTMKGHTIGLFVAWRFSKEAIEYIAEVQRAEGKEIRPIECKADVFHDLLISQNKEEKLLQYFWRFTQGQRAFSFEKVNKISKLH